MVQTCKSDEQVADMQSVIPFKNKHKISKYLTFSLLLYIFHLYLSKGRRGTLQRSPKEKEEKKKHLYQQTLMLISIVYRNIMKGYLNSVFYVISIFFSVIFCYYFCMKVSPFPLFFFSFLNEYFGFAC